MYDVNYLAWWKKYLFWFRFGLTFNSTAIYFCVLSDLRGLFFIPQSSRRTLRKLVNTKIGFNQLSNFIKSMISNVEPTPKSLNYKNMPQKL
jgi:hypothetical protein